MIITAMNAYHVIKKFSSLKSEKYILSVLYKLLRGKKKWMPNLLALPHFNSDKKQTEIPLS